MTTEDIDIDQFYFLARQHYAQMELPEDEIVSDLKTIENQAIKIVLDSDMLPYPSVDVRLEIEYENEEMYLLAINYSYEKEIVDEYFYPIERGRLASGKNEEGRMHRANRQRHKAVTIDQLSPPEFYELARARFASSELPAKVEDNVTEILDVQFAVVVDNAEFKTPFFEIILDVRYENSDDPYTFLLYLSQNKEFLDERFFK